MGRKESNQTNKTKPFLMESNLQLSQIPRLHWMILDTSPELIPQRLYRIKNGLIRLTRYWTKWTDLDEKTSENQLSETCHF